MRIGIIGAGGIGQALAQRSASAGIEVVIANSRGPTSLAALTRLLGQNIRAGSVGEAAEPEIVFLAVPWRHLPDAVADIADWEGRIVIDPTNPIGPPDFKRADLDGLTSSEVVARLVPGAYVVKAFNTLRPDILASDPREAGGQRVIFFSGDHDRAKAEIARLIDRLGFFGIDLGRLAEGGRLQQFPGGPLPSLNLVRLPG